MRVSNAGVLLVLVLGVAVGGTSALAHSASDFWHTIKHWMFPTVTSEPLSHPNLQCQQDGRCNVTNVTVSESNDGHDALQTYKNSSLPDEVISTTATSNLTLSEEDNWNSNIDGNVTKSQEETAEADAESEYIDSEYSTTGNTQNFTEIKKVRTRRSVNASETNADTALESRVDNRSLPINDGNSKTTKGSIEILQNILNESVIKDKEIGDSSAYSQKGGELIESSNEQTAVNYTEAYNGYERNATFLNAHNQEDIILKDKCAMNISVNANVTIVDDVCNNETEIFHLNDTDHFDIKLNLNVTNVTKDDEQIFSSQILQKTASLNEVNQFSKKDAGLQPEVKFTMKLLNEINSTLSAIKAVAQSCDGTINKPTEWLMNMNNNTTSDKINTVETKSCVTASNTASMEMSLDDLTNKSFVNENIFEKENLTVKYEGNYTTTKSMLLSAVNGHVKYDRKLNKKMEVDILTNSSQELSTVEEISVLNISLSKDIINITATPTDSMGTTKRGLTVSVAADINRGQPTEPAVTIDGQHYVNASQSKQDANSTDLKGTSVRVPTNTTNTSKVLQ